MKPKQLRWLSLAIFSVVLGLTAVLVVRQWPEISAFPWHLHPGFLILTMLFHSLALGSTYVVWHLMVVRLTGFQSWRDDFRIYYTSTLAKRVPTSLPYIGGRLAMYSEFGVAASAILSCIALENILIGMGGILTFLVFLPFEGRLAWTAGPVSVIGLALVVVVLVRPGLFVDIINRVLRRFGKRPIEQRPERRDILFWTGLYITPWLLAGAAFYCLPRAFSDSQAPGLIASIEISTVTMLLALLSVILPGGLGFKELAAGALLSPWMPFSTAVIISLAYRLLQTLDEIMVSLVAYVTPLGRGKPARADSPKPNMTPAPNPTKMAQE